MPIAGRATPEGTARYKEIALERRIDEGHFRNFESLTLSSIGAGTYPGSMKSEMDGDIEEAVYRSISSGAVNVVDTAINYRSQKAERVVGRALRRFSLERPDGRLGIFVCTKNGYLTSDGDLTTEFWTYVHTQFVKPGTLKVEEIAGDVHAMSVPFLRDQFERSLRNMGLETLDLMYLYNPAESWLQESGYRRFMERLGDAFSYYEKERSSGRLQYYGLASWTSFRTPKGESGHLNLDDVVDVARNAGGDAHGFRFIQVPFNPALNEALILRNQRIADEYVTIFEAAQKLGIRVFTNTPFGEGMLLGDPRIPELLGSRALALLQFARSASPALLAPLIGQNNIENLQENLRVAEIPPLTEKEFSRTYGQLLQQP